MTMTDLDRFEGQLEARLLAHVEGSVRSFDPLRLSREAATAAGRRGRIGRLLDDRVVPSRLVLARPVLLLLLMLALVGATVALVGSRVLEPSPGPFLERRVLGSLVSPRCGGTAVGLADGGALVVGGSDDDSLMATGERYDAVTGTFRRVTGTAPVGGGSSATLLSDGRVLITGGRAVMWAEACQERERGTIDDAYMLDPTSDRIEPVGSLTTARLGHASILLDDGRVLIVGGKGATSENGTGPLDSAEVFDPTTGTFRPTGSMARTRGAVAGLSEHHEPHAARLPDGRVLVTGGVDEGGPYAEVYDPVTEIWSLPSPDPAATAADRILVHGARCGALHASCIDWFDPSTATFSHAWVATPWTDHQGQVFVIDGSRAFLVDGQRVTMRDLDSGEEAAIPWASEGFRRWSALAVLEDGSLLAAGGNLASDDDNAPTAQVERFIPGD